MNIAIIPARGGSKRMPRKNISDFHGQPIIYYPIKVALDSGLFERVFVSTEDAEIADVAKRGGAEIVERPLALADDHTGTQAVMRHALECLRTMDVFPEFACCIYATTPFLHKNYLIEGWKMMAHQSKPPYAFSVKRYDSAIQRSLRRNKQGQMEIVWPQFADTRSQDLEPRWRDAGQFYWGRPEAFMQDVPIFKSGAMGVPMPHFMAIDIDDQDDWKFASFVYAGMRAAGQLP